MLKCFSFFVISFFVSVQLFAQEDQDSHKDSLVELYNTTKVDTTKIQTLLMLSEIYYRTNPDTLIVMCEQALRFIDQKLKSNPSAAEKEIYTINKGTAFTNMALVYEDRGDLKKSFECNNKGLEYYKSVKYYLGVSTVLNNLGKIMKLQGELDEALRLYAESLKYADLCNDRKGKAYTIGNIGAIHYSNGNFNEALENFIRAKVIHKDVNDIYGLVISLSNIGSVYRNLNKLDLALASYLETNDLCIQTGNLKQQSKTSLKLSLVYGLKNDFINAERYGLLALTQAIDGETAQDLLKAKKNLYEFYKKLNKPYKSLTFYEEYVLLRDSLENEDNQKAIIEQRIQFDYDRKLIADSIQFEIEKKAELEVKNIEIKQGKKQRLMLYGGLSIFIILSIFIYHRYRVSIKQSKIISDQKFIVESQKLLVEEKNKEITDSINYAKRIQTAILPSVARVKQLLPNSFIFYKPKDIVAGDFYWLDRFGGNILFSVADCTGHGVPGALVSVVCSNALHHSLEELKTSDPAKLLDHAREIIIKLFSKNHDNVRDGMDIALCSVNFKSLELKYAGANNSLYIVRNNELLEYPSTREPVGMHYKKTPFCNHIIQLQKSDVIYLFTDGYVDQFGGDNGKKLKYKPFKELILSINKHSIDDQERLLSDFFAKWKGEFDQVDDVCVLGVRI